MFRPDLNSTFRKMLRMDLVAVFLANCFLFVHATNSSTNATALTSSLASHNVSQNVWSAASSTYSGALGMETWSSKNERVVSSVANSRKNMNTSGAVSTGDVSGNSKNSLIAGSYSDSSRLPVYRGGGSSTGNAHREQGGATISINTDVEATASAGVLSASLNSNNDSQNASEKVGTTSSTYLGNATRTHELVPKNTSSFYAKSEAVLSISPTTTTAKHTHTANNTSGGGNYASIHPLFIGYHSNCASGHSEVVQNMRYGWKNTDTNGFGNVIADMVDDLTNRESENIAANDFVAFTQRGGLQCGMWSGAMVSNSDTLKYIAGKIRQNLDGEGIPDGKYFEYVSSDGDPMKGFGIYCQVNVAGSDAGLAVKAWSEGKSASSKVNGISGSASFGSQSICYVSYAGRKSGNLAYSMYKNTIGKCDYATLSSGQTASSACGVSGDSLTYYNPGMDFSSLSVGDYVCCSVGDGEAVDPAASYKCPSGDDKSVMPITYGWQTTDTTTFGGVVADMITDLMNFYRQNPNDFTSFKQRGGLKCGSWMGAMFDIKGSADSLEKTLRTNLQNEGIPRAKFYEHISSDGNPMKNFGVFCSVNGDPEDSVRAVKGWSEGKSASDVVGGISGTASISHQPVCFTSYSGRRAGDGIDPNLDTCNYARVKSGQSASEACSGLSGDVLAYYNGGVNLNQVQPGQPVCCSVGHMPDFRPHENSDGSCYVHEFKEGDTCTSVLAQYYPLSNDDLMKYNKDTFGWYGCTDGHPWKGDKICLSSGRPPRPTPNPQAQCGPQAPGDKYNSECPLNACCSEYGFCGLTDEFCKTKDSLTGAPGTTGCLSNCGMPSLSSGESSNSWTSVSYFDGTKNASILDYGDEYDVIHLGFANVARDHQSIDVSSVQQNYDDFAQIKAKKVLSIGGWDFSTDKSTYSILRDAIENDYDNFANVVVSFMQQKDHAFLDGFDIDWEYPGEPDIPGIPSDNSDAGSKYLEFLKAVRLRIDDSKSLSIAIPSSYWYLQHFPIKEISQYVDYVVFMTYDLHGQWDYSEKYSGGPHVQCHTDLVETEDALRMIIKAGVPKSKVRVGIANYARTYKLVDSSCDTVGCEFTGPSSGATPGPNTDTPGILSITEIREIVANGKMDYEYNNQTSECTNMRYDGDQWAAWTTENSQRIEQYKSWGFGGSSLWVANYEKGTTNPDDDGDDDDDDDDDDNYFNVDFSDLKPMIFSSLNNRECWDTYSSNTNFSITTDGGKCQVEAMLAALLNNAEDSINYISSIYDDEDNLDKFNSNSYPNYHKFFSKNMSHAYQEWSLSMLHQHSEWFKCFDANGDAMSCVDAYNLGYEEGYPCENNCCPGLGCYKSGKYLDSSYVAKCKKESVSPTCCDPDASLTDFNGQSKRAATEDLNNATSDFFDVHNSAYDSIFNNTIHMMEEGLLSSSDSDSYADADEPWKNVLFGHSGKGRQITGWQLNHDTSSAALSSFSNTSGIGYNVRWDQMYIQPFYRYQQPLPKHPQCFKDQSSNVTIKCFMVPNDNLFLYNPMKQVNDTMLEQGRNLISNVRNAIDTNSDYYSYLLTAAAPALSTYLTLNSTISHIVNIGTDYQSKCTRYEVLEILEPLLDALSALLFFLGPEAGFAATVATEAIELGVNPDTSADDIIEGLVSIVGAEVFRVGADEVGALGLAGSRIGKLGGMFRSVRPVMDEIEDGLKRGVGAMCKA